MEDRTGQVSNSLDRCARSMRKVTMTSIQLPHSSGRMDEHSSTAAEMHANPASPSCEVTRMMPLMESTSAKHPEP